MPLSSISPTRPLTSYAKVRTIVGHLLRNRGLQLRRPRPAGLAYLNLGCGPNSHASFINLDFLWHPGIDVCWDITRGLPFATASLRGVFSEHCLEHFNRRQAQAILREIRRVLAPGGTLRLVVPDAELYLRTYVSQLDGNTTCTFPYQENEQRRAAWSPLASVNRVFYQDRESPFGHRCMYDFASFALLLQECGFVRATRRQFGEGGDPALLIDSASRRVESLYVEACVP